MNEEIKHEIWGIVEAHNKRCQTIDEQFGHIERHLIAKLRDESLERMIEELQLPLASTFKEKVVLANELRKH